MALKKPLMLGDYDSQDKTKKNIKINLTFEEKDITLMVSAIKTVNESLLTLESVVSELKSATATKT